MISRKLVIEVGWLVGLWLILMIGCCLGQVLAEDGQSESSPESLSLADETQLRVDQKNDLLFAQVVDLETASQLTVLRPKDQVFEGCLATDLTPETNLEAVEGYSDGYLFKLNSSLNNRWLCLELTVGQSVWRQPHFVSRLEAVPAQISVSQTSSEITVQASRPMAAWYYYEETSRPACQVNPVVSVGQEADPPLHQWTKDHPSLNSNQSETTDLKEKIVFTKGSRPTSYWICFLAITEADVHGNSLYSYQSVLVNQEETTDALRGFLFLIGLNVLIVCFGAAIGIFLYRRDKTPDS